MKETNCRICKKTLVGRQKGFCSISCRNKGFGVISSSFKKEREKNPNWKGGISRGYARTLKKHIDFCQKCNKEVKGTKKNVHHIDDNPKNNELSNLQVLCVSCHQLTKKSSWDEEETKKLIYLERKGFNHKQIAKVLKKTPQAIRMKSYRLDKKIILDITVRADTKEELQQNLNEAVEVATVKCQLINNLLPK